MGMIDEGRHDLWGGMYERFLAYLPKLTKLRLSKLSKCTSKFCTQPVSAEQRGYATFNVRGNGTISQDSIDAALGPYTDKECLVEVPQKVTDRFESALRDDVFRKRTRIKEDDTTEVWYQCRGHREYDPARVVHLPYLLVVDCGAGIHGQLKPPPPAPSLTINGTEYLLAAIFYGDNRHFNCTVMIQGEAWFYDGIQSPPLSRPSGAQDRPPCVVWYLRRTKDGSGDLPDSNDSLSEDETHQDHPAPEEARSERDSANDAHQTSTENEASTSRPQTRSTLKKERNAESWEEDSWDQLDPWEHDQKKAGSKPPKKKSKTYYPYGISLAPVAKYGHQPCCQGCGFVIERGSMRVVYRGVAGKRQLGNPVFFYHCVDTCIDKASDLTSYDKTEAKKQIASLV
jgi:hypothetical protein